MLEISDSLIRKKVVHRVKKRPGQNPNKFLSGFAVNIWSSRLTNKKMTAILHDSCTVINKFEDFFFNLCISLELAYYLSVLRYSDREGS